MARDEHGNWKPDAPGFERRDQLEMETDGACSSDKRNSSIKVCPGCHMKVVIHCDDCGIQTSGCICLLVEKHGVEIAAAMARERGLILPKDFDPNAPTTPDLLH